MFYLTPYRDPLREHLRIHEIVIVDQNTGYFFLIITRSSPSNHMLWLSIRIASAISQKFDEIIRVFLLEPLFHCTYLLNCYDSQGARKTNIGHRVAAKICRNTILADAF